jgi:hypothetical protein
VKITVLDNDELKAWETDESICSTRERLVRDSVDSSSVDSSSVDSSSVDSSHSFCLCIILIIAAFFLVL